MQTQEGIEGDKGADIGIKSDRRRQWHLSDAGIQTDFQEGNEDAKYVQNEQGQIL